MIKIKNLDNIIFISRNFNLFGYSVLKRLIKSNKIPKLIILPKLESIDLRKKKYLNYFFDVYKNLEPIEALSNKYKIKLRRLDSLNSQNSKKFIKKFKPELIFIGGGWPELIDKTINKISKFGGINLHPSILPNFRGGDIIRWQIKENSKNFGVTFHKINSKFDFGTIILQKKIKIKIRNPYLISRKLSLLSSKFINKLLKIDLSSAIIKTNKNTPYYHKWNWLDKNFFEIKIEKLNHLSELFYFINAAKNFPNNYNGPFLNYENKKFIIRECKLIKIKNLCSSNSVKFNNKSIILKIKNSKINLKITKIQFFNEKMWRSNYIKSKYITENFRKIFI